MLVKLEAGWGKPSLMQALQAALPASSVDFSCGCGANLFCCRLSAAAALCHSCVL